MSLIHWRLNIPGNSKPTKIVAQSTEKQAKVDVFALMREHRRVSPNICDSTFTWSMDSDTIHENMVLRCSNIFEIDKNTGKQILKLKQTPV